LGLRLCRNSSIAFLGKRTAVLKLIGLKHVE
jgi:hypothetical protein